MFGYGILGGGLAGVAMAEALCRQGVSPADIVLIEKKHLAAGASGAIGAMLNPFPGRSLRFKAGYEEAYLYVYDWILAQEREDQCSYSQEMPILRPLIEELGAEQMLRSFQEGRGSLPAMLTAEQLSAEEVTEAYPFLAKTDGGLRFSPALSVYYADLTKGVFARLVQKGLQHRVGHGASHLCREGNGAWRVQLDDHEDVLVERVIFSMGADLDQWFPALPLQVTGGELAAFRPPAGIDLSCMVSAAGYIAPERTGEWVVGATFWHGKKYSEFTEEEVFDRLRSKAARLIPAMQEAEPSRTWFGIRAIFRHDRQPLVGAIPGLPQVYVLGAFSSKGLLLSPWNAHALAMSLLGGASMVHPSAASERLDASFWKPEPSRFSGRL